MIFSQHYKEINAFIFCKINQLEKEMSDGKSLSKKVNERESLAPKATRIFDDDIDQTP